MDVDHYGYKNSSNFTSWGGGVLKVDGKYHLYASQIQGHCPLGGYWSSHSEAVHAVSNNPMGPFETVDVVVPAQAHNVKPFRAPDGTFLIYYVGPTTGATIDCTKLGGEPYPKEANGPVMIASASRPDAPAEEWEHHGPMTDSFEWHSATNPSPVFLPNGSVLMYVSRRWTFDDGHNEKSNFIMIADSWRGPYRNITRGYDDALHTGEDPHVFKTKRGYHMLNHNTGHNSTIISFSEDGLTWVSGKSLKSLGWQNAFDGTLQWSNNTVTKLCKRQRPYIVFKEDGMPGWLWAGVIESQGDAIWGEDCAKSSLMPTWTLVQEIGRPMSTVV